MSGRGSTSTNTPVSRRTALRAGVAGAAGVTMTAGGVSPMSASQEAAPTGMRRERYEVDWAPVDPVTITLAGGGPPQRGDHFYVDGPIYAAGDVNGTQIGVYQCFGVWVAAADDVDATFQRLTSVQFLFDDGSISGMINEAGTGSAIGAVQGGTGRFLGASGTFNQFGLNAPGPDPSPGAPGTPGPGQYVLRTTFELIFPEGV